MSLLTSLYFTDLINTSRAVAIEQVFRQTDVSVWRYYCRQYSKMFHTPLHLVLEMEPYEVLLAVVEEQIDGVNLDDKAEELLEMLFSIEDPKYFALKQKELDKLDEEIEAEEAERVRLGLPIHTKRKLAKKAILKTEEPKPENLPPSGGINLSYLADQDAEGGGFDEP